MDLHDSGFRLLFEQQQRDAERLRQQIGLSPGIQALIDQQQSDAARWRQAIESVGNKSLMDQQARDAERMQNLIGYSPGTQALIDEQQRNAARWRQTMEPSEGSQAVLDQQARDAERMQKLIGPSQGIQNLIAEQNRDSELLRNTFAQSMDSVVATLLPWQTAAESLLRSLRTVDTDIYQGRRLLELAHAFDGSDIESDEEDSYASTSHDQLVLPVTREIILASAELNDQFLRHFVDHPGDLAKISPREFETLIADLFRGLGYEVELTAQTRDGGYDVVAVRRAETTTRSLIECKRYAVDRKVGVGVVRNLLGVVHSTRSTKGIVATTATFSRDAKQYINENQWQLEGHNLEGVIDWINRYLRKRS